MLYLANPSTPGIRRAMSEGHLGCMATPAQGNLVRSEWTWAADNGCFSEAWRAGKWLSFLEKNAEHEASCLFAVVPDKVAEPVETARRWDLWAPVVREFGYTRLAFVLQDGCSFVPWGELNCLFIGGSTEYKMSPEAERWAREAKARGKWVHWGRVNSRQRFAATALTGDSCDGTYLAFGPDVNLPKLLSWTNTLTFGASA